MVCALRQHMGKVEMKEIKFSVIVPCYNVEQYVEECVESVLAQTYPVWELILVDDASTDHTYDTIVRLSGRDERIRAFTKEHGGLPHTRNYAMKYAAGDYLALLDGDDFWDKDHLRKVKTIIDRSPADMIIHNQHTYFTKTWKAPAVFFPKTSEPLTAEDRLKTIFSLDHGLPGSAVVTVYQMEFCRRNGLRYEEHYKCSEDLDFFLAAVSKEPNIVFAYHEFYFYRQDNSNAMTKNITPEMLLDRLRIYEKWFQYFNGKKLGEFDCSEIRSKLSEDACVQLILYYDMKKEDRKKVRSFLKKHKSLFYYQRGRLVFLKGRIWYVFYLLKKAAGSLLE